MDWNKFWIGWGLLFGTFSLFNLLSGGYPLFDSTCMIINYGCAYYWWKQI